MVHNVVVHGNFCPGQIREQGGPLADSRDVLVHLRAVRYYVRDKVHGVFELFEALDPFSWVVRVDLMVCIPNFGVEVVEFG